MVNDLTLADAISSANTGLDAIKRAPIVDEDTGIKCIRIQDVNQKKQFLDWGNTQVEDRNFEKFQLKENDILVARTGGSIGSNKFINSKLPAVFNNGLIRVRIDEEKHNPKFIYYLLQTEAFKSHINAIAFSTSAQPNMKIKDFLRFEFKEIGLEAENNVENILTKLDDKIELNHQTNQTLEKMAQSLFKSWFVDFDQVFDNALANGMVVNDFPEALQEKAEQRQQVQQSIAAGELDYKQLPEDIRQLFPSEFEQVDDLVMGVDGWVPKGWKIKTIDELNKINPESWTKKNSPKEVRYVDLANAKNGRILGTVEYSFEDAPSRARRILKPHDTIIGVVRPANRSFAYINETGLTGSTGFAVVRPVEEYLRAFTYLSLTTDDSINEFARIADGAAYPAIKPQDVAKAICLYSSEQILKKFEVIAGEFINKKSANEQQQKPLAELRDALLPKLISGELTLPTTKDGV